MLSLILPRLPAKQKSTLRSLYYRTKQSFVRTFLSYGVPELTNALRSMGIQRGDTLMVHSSFPRACAFAGSPGEFIDSLLDVLGPDGHLLMVSLPYRSSSYEYVQQGRRFDVRRTVSHMGIVSETFRQRRGVLRSLHPTHPVLAFGPRASWIVAEHHHCLYPCGRGTPFEKLAQLGGKVLFFNASFFTFTFFHYLEESIKDRIDFHLFREEPFDVPVIDFAGNTVVVRTYVSSEEAIRKRRPEILKAELDRMGLIKKKRIGSSRLLLVNTSDALRCVDDMTMRGIFFYE